MTSVVLLALRGALPSSVAITLDVLDTANRLARRADASEAFAVTVLDGPCLDDRVLNDQGPSAERTIVIVPGLGMTTDEQVAKRLAEPDATLSAELLRQAEQTGAEVAASCAGVFLVAEAGLLDHRRATTTWWLAPAFRRRYPDVVLMPDELVVTHHPVTTAGAAMAHLDLMLTLVGRHAGEALARKCASYLAADRRDNQSRYLVLGDLVVDDSDVSKAIAWAFDHVDEGLTVNDLAEAVHLSPRTFARRVRDAAGLSPIRLLRRVRVERAIALLEGTDMPVDTVAREVGYTEPTALRRAMAQELGLTPSTVRRRT